MKTEDVIKSVLPQFFPKHWLDNPGMVFTDFPSRIRIGYVIRGDGAYQYICDEEFSRLQIPVEELHSAALSNLTALGSANIKTAKLPGGAEGWIEAAEDNFAAVRILLPKAQQMFREVLGEEFFLSLPHRDDCFCWSVTQPLESQEKHAKQALEDFLQEDYNLTPDILKCSQRGFQLHREQVVD